MHEVTLSLHELFYSSIRQLGKTANANDILAFTHCSSICNFSLTVLLFMTRERPMTWERPGAGFVPSPCFCVSKHTRRYSSDDKTLGSLWPDFNVTGCVSDRLERYHTHRALRRAPSFHFLCCEFDEAIQALLPQCGYWVLSYLQKHESRHLGCIPW